MQIQRKTANLIMSKAIHLLDHCLMGVVLPTGDIKLCDRCDNMQALVEQYPAAIRFYNQHADAVKSMEGIPQQQGQLTIEIFQDTEGVFGLRAWRLDGKLQTTEDLEFAE